MDAVIVYAPTFLGVIGSPSLTMLINCVCIPYTPALLKTIGPCIFIMSLTDSRFLPRQWCTYGPASIIMLWRVLIVDVYDLEVSILPFAVFAVIGLVSGVILLGAFRRKKRLAALSFTILPRSVLCILVACTLYLRYDLTGFSFSLFAANSFLWFQLTPSWVTYWSIFRGRIHAN